MCADIVAPQCRVLRVEQHAQLGATRCCQQPQIARPRPACSRSRSSPDGRPRESQASARTSAVRRRSASVADLARAEAGQEHERHVHLDRGVDRDPDGAGTSRGVRRAGRAGEPEVVEVAWRDRGDRRRRSRCDAREVARRAPRRRPAGGRRPTPRSSGGSPRSRALPPGHRLGSVAVDGPLGHPDPARRAPAVHRATVATAARCRRPAVSSRRDPRRPERPRFAHGLAAPCDACRTGSRARAPSTPPRHSATCRVSPCSRAPGPAATRAGRT